MPSKRACAKCGELNYIGRGTLPEGEYQCRRCRRNKRMTKRMMTRHYLTLDQVEKHIGVRPGSLIGSNDLPPVDGVVGPIDDNGDLLPGSTQIWLVSTINVWRTGQPVRRRVHQVHRPCDGTKDFLSAYDLELLTGTPASTWRYWASIGQAPPSQKIGRRRVYPRDSAMEWLRERGAVDA